MPLGRPIIFDAVKQAKLCGMLAMGCSRAAAARYVGIAPSTIRRLMLANPEFREQIRQAEMDAEMLPLGEIRKAASKSWRAAAWYLQHFDPGRWGRHAKPRRERNDERFEDVLWTDAAVETNVTLPEETRDDDCSITPANKPHRSQRTTKKKPPPASPPDASPACPAPLQTSDDSDCNEMPKMSDTFGASKVPDTAPSTAKSHDLQRVISPARPAGNKAELCEQASLLISRRITERLQKMKA